MTPPRLIWDPEARPVLACSDCEPGARLIVETPERPFTEALDRFIPTLPAPELRIHPPATRPHLLTLSWGHAPLLSPERLQPSVLLTQRVPPLSEAFIVSEPLSFIDFIPALRTLANQAESLDLDIFNIPVNRGGGHCRFSEYAPRRERTHDCNREVQAGTTARGHGEIRPIRGTDRSQITRVVIDFDHNIINYAPVPAFAQWLLGSRMAIEIDGFSAVDPLIMTFNRAFPGREDASILSSEGGDRSYENPLSSGDRLITPFDSVAEPPPGGHNYWMFRFSQIVASAIDELARARAEPQLQLWAFLPTMGITEDRSYEELGIPFDTFPRALGDILQLLSPLFSRATREAARARAPYFNPNTEYLDFEEVRHPIPDDPAELARINRERIEYNRAHPEEPPYPRIEINRGGVLDWVFLDLQGDPARLERLLGAAPENIPYLTSRIRFREARLELPMGSVTVAAGSEARIHYRIEPYRDEATGEVRARLAGRLTFSPLILRDVDLNFQNYHLRARRLRAQELVIHAPDLQGLFSGTLDGEHSLQVSLEGVNVSGLELADRRSGLAGELGSASLGSLNLSYHSGAWNMTIGAEGEGLSLRNLAIQTLLGRLAFESASVPDLTLRSTRSEAGGGRGVTLSVPTVSSRSRLSFSYHPSSGGSPLSLRLLGESSLSDLVYYYRPSGPVRHQASFDVSGQVREARIEHDWIGAILLSTLRGEGREESEAMSGQVQLRFLNPDVREEGAADEPLLQPEITLDLPFMGLGSEEGNLRIPRESSTIENGRLEVHPNSFSIQGELNIRDARWRGPPEGRLEFGDYVISAEELELSEIRAEGPVRFVNSRDGWRLTRIPGEAEPVNLGMNIENLGFVYHNPPGFLPRSIPRVPRIPEVFQTRVDLRHADVEIEDLLAIHFERTVGANGERRGRLSRLDSGPITAHHLSGAGSIWAPLPIWGMVRGFFPILGSVPLGLAPTRPDPGPLVAHLPEDVRCALGDGDFIRIGRTRYQFYPMTPALRSDREARNLRTEAPRGDWEARIRDLIINTHESSVPDGPPSRNQFGMIRIPELNFGRVWTEESRAEFQNCPAAAEGESCGEERGYFNLGLGEFLAHIFLNDPQRGGSFHFPRWPEEATRESLTTLLSSCPAP